MTFSMASLGVPQISSPSSLPFGAGPIPVNNNLFQSSFTSANLNQLPWQQSEQLGSLRQQDSLLQLLQQNRKQLDTPFAQQSTPTNGGQEMITQFPWLQNLFQENNIDTDKGNKTQGQEQDWFKQLQSNAEHNTASKENEDGKEEEENNEELEELHEQFEEFLERNEEQKKETFKDLQLMVLLLYSFLALDVPVAIYFILIELVKLVVTKAGINDEDNLLFILFIQCMDVVALSRGRPKLVVGYKEYWYQELFDYIFIKLGISDIIRVGTHFFMPKTSGPEYEIL